MKSFWILVVALLLVSVCFADGKKSRHKKKREKAVETSDSSTEVEDKRSHGDNKQKVNDVAFLFSTIRRCGQNGKRSEKVIFVNMLISPKTRLRICSAQALQEIEDNTAETGLTELHDYIRNQTCHEFKSTNPKLRTKCEKEPVICSFG